MASRLDGRMVFLVGARRSGTNWLQRTLGAHPSVAVVPSETHLFSHGIAPLAERFHHGARGSPQTAAMHIDRSELMVALRAFCDRAFAPYLDSQPRAQLLIERSPWHVEHLPLISAVYPDSRVLHIVRDGRDVARSLVAQDWGETKPADIREAAGEWVRAVRAATGAAPGLRSYREVRYEELFARPRQGIAEIFEWLGLEMDDEVAHRVAAEAGSRFNVDPTSPTVAPGKWRTGLSTADVAAVLEVAGETLVELGYADGAVAEPHRRPPARRHVARIVGQLRKGLAGHARAQEAPRVGGDLDMQRQIASVDRVLAALHTDCATDLHAMAIPDVRVRLVGGGRDWTGRGPAALDSLLGATRADGLAAAHQRRGDVHPGAGTFAVVATYQPGAGDAFDVVVVVHPRGDRVAGISYYRFPLPIDDEPARAPGQGG